MDTDLPLRIAFLTYRGKKTVGGQGVYTRQLTRAMTDLGHSVEVFSGPEWPETDPRVPLHALPSLDFYNEKHPLRLPRPHQMKSWGDWVEFGKFLTGQFPEPLAFSVRARQALIPRINEFDLAQDNQSLGSGLLGLQRAGLPVLGTIHHPTTVDRRLEWEAASNWRERFFKDRWYSFTDMQTRVARDISRLVTVSENSLADIHRDHKIPMDRMHVVPVGVDQELFRPLPNIAPKKGRLVTTASADAAMKGLKFLLEALAMLRRDRDVDLVVIGKLRPDGPAARTIEKLGIQDAVTFIKGVSDERLIEIFNEAEVGVVPSLYEGFSLPAVELMCCGVPLVATTGGALPEVVGPDGETALLVEPGNSLALAERIGVAMDQPELREKIRHAGRRRVLERWTWEHSAKGTLEQYRALLDESGAIEARRPGGRQGAPRFRARA
ncbi:MAG: glycosyltransferase family 4 protein [Candidatus Binatia bacterium]|nr:glycosyltransferase family 4 protein [Candidatus Binatia bacterium]MDG2008194.1 glycosyltransferase family 4 protein [Candidatus Binatia bacterium]HAC80758.1 glycosyl transferase family 1 [Deltaproteobacteria bacterium]